MVEPFNIRRRKAADQEYYLRDEAEKRAQLTAVQADWNERQAHKSHNPREAATQEKSLLEDLELSAKQLTLARRQRLRQLYADEMAIWQMELAAKGLVISTSTK